jgi:hypothetical protein
VTACNINLSVEVGRWQNGLLYCASEVILGESFTTYAYIMQSRRAYMPWYFHLHPNVFKFENFNTTHTKLLRKVCTFIKPIIEKVSFSGYKYPRVNFA